VAYFDSTSDGLKPGIDRWRVASAEDRPSKNGDQMWALKLVRVSDPSDDMRAYLMMGGKMKFLGRKQLTAFLPVGFAGNVTAETLRDVVVYVDTVVEPYKGTPQLVVNRESPLRCGGFQRESEPPDGYELPPGHTTEPSEVPF
jgi:hypothetical protein